MCDTAIYPYSFVYDIENYYDQDGDFPILCATLLFDVMGIHENAVISNWCALSKERDSIIDRYKSLYDLDSKIWDKRKSYLLNTGIKHSKCDFCVWVKSRYESNTELIELMKLQTIDLRYIAVTKHFDWDKFINECDNNICCLDDLDGFKASCIISDMDRTLNLHFNPNIYSAEQIKSILSDWEKAVSKYTNSLIVDRSLSNEVINRHKKVLRIHLLYK